MTLNNPFSDYGGIVTGERFVGRHVEINQIRSRLFGQSFGNLAIVGLPRIGKSSLAWNSIISNRTTLLTEKILPIWIPLGEFLNLIDFLDETLANISELFEIHSELDKFHFNDLKKKFDEAISNTEKRRFVKKIFRKLKDDGYRLILVIDEFDNAQDIFTLQDFQFLREISYNLETKIAIVTISRKTIRELEPDNGSLSNFYQVFDDLRLKMFSDSDEAFYWQRLTSIGFKVSGYSVNADPVPGILTPLI